MIALDTNVVLHFLIESQVKHPLVRRWFQQNENPLVLTPTNVGEVLRLLTHPQVFPKPLPLKKALQVWDDFLEAFDISILEEETNWWKNLPIILNEYPNLVGNKIFDARIALCLHYHKIKNILTFDQDFQKFSFLKMVKI